MKTRNFYYFAIGICVLLVLILLWVMYKGHHPRVPTARNAKAFQARTPGSSQPKRQQPANQTITAFQFITDKLNKMGVTITSVDVDVKNGIVKWDSNSKWGEYYGKSDSKSQTISPVILKQHQKAKTDPQGIRGCYQTKWGLLRLYIKDDVVTGTLSYYGPTHIIGKLKDNILVGTWIRPAYKNRPMLVGPMQFAFSNDWSSFKSVWKYKKEPEFNSNWEGTKIACPARGTKLEQKLVPGGPGVPVRPKPKPGEAKPGNPAEKTNQLKV